MILRFSPQFPCYPHSTFSIPQPFFHQCADCSRQVCFYVVYMIPFWGCLLMKWLHPCTHPRLRELDQLHRIRQSCVQLHPLVPVYFKTSHHD
ncbi:hypothetical protein BDZ91DRAFT_737611 [Kalaharituber pfeilii]|nr:hypothetical protein BDZ91DRAFT_737611 [Kalaharituber pfeilii]